MIYIGFDQSSKVTGYAAIDHEGNLLEYGVFKTPDTSDLMMRASYILHFIDEFISKYKDNGIIVGIEDTQESRQNTNTFQLLTKILGVIEYNLFVQNIPYIVCHVSSWRSVAGVKGKRREEKKKHAMEIVKEKFGMRKVEEDAAEAVLIAEYVRQKA